MTEVEMRGGDLCSLEVRVRICRTYRRRGLNCGIVRRHGGPVEPRLYRGRGAKGYTAVRLSLSESENTVLYCTLPRRPGRDWQCTFRERAEQGRRRGVPIRLPFTTANVERKREGESMRGVMMMAHKPTAVCHVPFD